MATNAALAVVPTIYPGAAFTKISPNGEWAISFYYEQVAIYDLVSGQVHEYLPSEDGTLSYGIGNGNTISNDGIVVGSTSAFSNGAYWKDGKWNLIQSVAGRNTSLNGITADGKRICGSIAPEGHDGSYDGLMLQPVVFEMQENGTYGEPILLPYPEKDVTNRVPQYVTALCISDDGKTIAGQQVDYRGSTIQPVIYHQDESGTWSYYIPQEELFHPEGVTIPDDPGECDYPDQVNFMSEEERAAYDKAVEDWELLGEGYETYPKYGDFMTPEETAAYEKAVDEYNAWIEKFMAFSDAYEEYASKVPSFSFNNVVLTPDGRYMATTDCISEYDPMTWSLLVENTPYRFDLVEKKYSKYENDAKIGMSAMAADGTMLGCTPLMGTTPPEAYILPIGEQKFISLYDYYCSTAPAMAAWMKENMTHEYEVYDMETMTPVTKTSMITGIPTCNSDLSVVGSFAENVWDFESADAAMVYGYLFSPGMAGIKEVAGGSSLTVKSTGNGNLAINGDAASVEVYDMGGRTVYTAAAPGATVATGLGAGVYMVKVTDANGNTTTVKVSI